MKTIILRKHKGKVHSRVVTGAEITLCAAVMEELGKEYDEIVIKTPTLKEL